MVKPPWTTWIMLLKSWAMPPVSWPTASIFCACANRSSLSRSAAFASWNWAGEGNWIIVGSKRHSAAAVQIETKAVIALTTA